MEWPALPFTNRPQVVNDSIDTEPRPDLKYPVSDIPSVPQVGQPDTEGMGLPMPANFEYTTQYDAATNSVTIYRRIGGIDVRLPYTMTLQEYLNQDTRRSIMNYWQTRQSQNGSQQTDQGQGGLINSNWQVQNEAFSSVFGGNQINMRLQGMAELKIGIQQTKIDNPTLQERMRKTTNFDFDQTIQMNLNAQVGERLKLGVNYNTQATFDFENQLKLDFSGSEDDIVKKVEAGNVTLPLPGTLITGSQSLFGVKTELQFGKLNVTTIFSQQKGETSVMNMEGGAQTQLIDVRADQYDRNRHFFLAHKFRDLYNQSLASLPFVNSPINITRVEVWITNRSGNFNEARNIIGFLDIGETGSNLSNTVLWSGSPQAMPSNEANNLYGEMTSSYSGIRDINQVATLFSSLENMNFNGGKDYEKIESARLLSPNEYTVNENLGYISLNSALNSDEILAVAFEYTYMGQNYKVGEFSNSGIQAPNALFLKLLKGTNLTPRYKNWNLMMKNIYSINAYQVNRDDFELNVVYVNDSTGSDINYFPEGLKPDQGGINGKTFLEILNLDQLNSQLDPTPDGMFDFVEDYTIISENGRIIFPVLEPFGSSLRDKLSNQPQLIKKYVFQELYDSTQIVAEQIAAKNKFKLKGHYKSASSAEIMLNAVNVAQGSVIVTAGGLKLVENVDYTVDYALGRVRIINQGLLQSGTPIQVSLENQSMFNVQTKTLLGAHFDYRFNENFNLGATIMHLSEKPLTQKVNYGDEPISNTIWGLNTSFQKESMGLTRLIDKLPLVSTKEPSTITFEGEFAQLIPGSSSAIKNAAYIDDFEGTRTSYDMKNWTAWKLSSVPQGQTSLFPNSDKINDLSSGFNRAKLAWYVIDPLFARNLSATPSHIKNDPDQQSNHYVREVYESEIFPNRQSAYGQPTNISVLNMVYYPNERGPYNFNTNLTQQGFLTNPKDNWGGIQRKLESNDFESANIEYIEFWVLDPFIYDDTKEGGELFFNIGNISEDVLRDSRKSFEQGLPIPGEEFDVDSTNWGYVSKKQSLVNAFNTDPASLRAQDVGLNGMNSEKERYFYRKSSHPYLNIIDQMYNSGMLDEQAYRNIVNDPAGDDYHYFRGSDYDAAQTSVLDRYKNFNNTEGNSVPSEYSTESYSTASVTLPDNEDLNNDNTLNENENYYQYRVSIRPDSMVVGKNNIADVVEASVKLKNGKTEQVKWYQFKIPLNQPQKTVGSISDMRSMRFMRMYMTGFSDTCILRFATLDLVRGEWRKYTNQLYDEGSIPSASAEMETFAINIEENNRKTPVNYILPPGIDRVIDPANPQLRELNEQALLMRVHDLAGGDARAVYKTLNMDMRQYKRIKMFIHAEAIEGEPLEDEQMSAFIRLGTDYTDNYYEYEIPLKLTLPGIYSSIETDRYLVWPEENELNVPLDLFQQVKLRRNDEKRKSGSTLTFSDVYSWPDPNNTKNRVRIKGNPNLSNVVTVMIGTRARGTGQKSAEVWFNELRLTDFNEDGGWAANARTTIKLADLGSVSVAGQMSTVGFGSIEKSVNERNQEDFHQYDVATNLELGKLLGPKSRLSVPFYFGYSKSVANPKYYPLDPDVPLDVALDNAASEADRDSIKNISQTVISRKSINFTNVRLNPKGAEVPFYSVSNLSASYSYSETNKRDIDTQYETNRDFNGSLAYNFNGNPKVIEPFKSSKLNPRLFKLITDFNFSYSPVQMSYRWEIGRQYNERQTRNITNPNYKIPLNVSKDFDWNRYFDLRYNLTRSLKLGFRTSTNARIDEPDGPVNKKLYRDEYYEWRDSVMQNILSFGRVTNYQHNIDVNYNLPINKLPYLDFINGTLQYRGMYQWDAGLVKQTEFNWGNTIRNSNTIQANGQLNMNTLYNRSAYLKDLTRKYGTTKQPNQENASRTVRYNENNVTLQKQKPLVINHKLKTTEINVRVFDANGRPVQGTINVVNASRAEFIPSADATDARILVTGTVTDNNNAWQKIKDYTAMTLTSLKNLTVTYSGNHGTIMPGYMPNSEFMGADRINGMIAPGIPFMLGWQDRDFALDAVRNGWLSTDTTLNNPFVMTTTEDFSIKATFEPIAGLRIELTADRRYNNSMSEYYLFDDNGFKGVYNTMDRGSFSMTYNAFKTSFKHIGKKGDLNSSLFDKFMDNRQVIANRLASKRVGSNYPTTGKYQGTAIAGLPYKPNGYPELGYGVESGTDGYALNSQEVLIPAFLAAYSGGSAGNIFLDAIPSLAHIQPNWRISYDGLGKIKPFNKVMRSFDISHAYRSTYSVGSFLTNLDWEDSGGGISFIRDLQDNFIPELQISTVSLTEQFSPLIQFNITWINNLTTRAEIKNGRTLSLSLTGNQVIENYTKEYVIGLGYRFDKLAMILGKGSDAKSITSDLNLRADLSIRDNFSIIRKVQEQVNQLTSGMKIITLKFTADYAFTQRFNMQVFYDKSINKPYISSSYPIKTTNYGVSFRFALTQ